MITLNFSDPFPLQVTGGDGSSQDQAIRIEAPDSSLAIDLENFFLGLAFGYKPDKRAQELVVGGEGRQYDVLTVTDRSGKEWEFWFEITSAIQGNLKMLELRESLQQAPLRRQSFRLAFGTYLLTLAAVVLRGALDSQEVTSDVDPRAIYAEFLIGSGMNLILAALPGEFIEGQVQAASTIMEPLAMAWRRLGGCPWLRGPDR